MEKRGKAIIGYFEARLSWVNSWCSSPFSLPDVQGLVGANSFGISAGISLGWSRSLKWIRGEVPRWRGAEEGGEEGACIWDYWILAANGRI